MASYDHGRTHKSHQLSATAAAAEVPRRDAKISPNGKSPAEGHKIQADVDEAGTIALFAPDTRGDRQNLTYGSLHQYTIPKYRTAGRGNLVGLGREFRVQRVSDSHREIRQGGLDPSRRQRNQSLLSSIGPESLAKFESKQQSFDEIVRQRDYVSFKSAQSNKRRRLSSDAPVWGEEDQEAVEETVESSSGDEDAEAIVDSQGDAFEVFRNDPRQQRQRELSEATAKRPDDFRGWLALIEHQAVMVLDLDRSEKQLTASQQRNVSELKMSLYEQALTKVTRAPGREKLVRGMMQEASKIWDKRKQQAEWQKILKQTPSFELWILYLNFQQTNSLNFSYDQCLESFTECYRIYSNDQLDISRDEKCVYLILRITIFMRQAGFMERAIGIWQALLEINFYRSRSQPLEQALSLFQDFWNSEVARVGEFGSRGWGSAQPLEVQQQVDPEPEKIDHSGIFESWGRAEENVEAQVMPARTLDDTTEDDPYRVILYSDVEQYIFILTSAESAKLLWNALLCFGGLPLVYRHPFSAEWTSDPFLREDDISSSDSNSMSTTPNAIRMTYNAVTESSNLFLAGENWFRAFTSVSPPAAWMLHVVQQIATTYTSDDLLGEYATALALHTAPKSARKVAKALLKQSPNSIRLYNAYAIVEWRLGNQETAERVWSTALAMNSSKGQDQRSDLFVLWHSWIWECIIVGNLNKSNALLVAIGDSRPDFEQINAAQTEPSRNPASFLKVSRLLESHISAALSFDRADDISLCVDLLALLHYHQNHRNLHAALEVFQMTLTNLSTRSKSATNLNMSIEMLHQRRAHLLHQHATSHSVDFKPKQIASLLAESIQAFPQNTIFLSLHQHYAQKCGLFDRIRERPVLTTLGAFDLTSHLFDIAAELKRPAFSGSTEHSIRAAFSRASEPTAPGHSCPGVWKAFVLWEIGLLPPASKSGKSKKTTSAFDTFHAAIRACPWAKELYMICFTDEKLRDTLGDAGLKAVYQSMVERGLRIRVNIDDLLGDKP